MKKDEYIFLSHYLNSDEEVMEYFPKTLSKKEVKKLIVMKANINLIGKAVIIGVILLFVKSQLNAQNYESIFGVNSTQWDIKMGNLWGEGTNQHIVTGDTIINANQYKIIGGYSIDGYQGYVREDINQGKAWYRNNQDTTEYLIMDLNLEIGDSMFIGGNWNSNPGYYEVDSIYEIANRKFIRFDFDLFFMNGLKFTLIEGITSNLGFRYQDRDYGNNFNPELLCSYKDELQEYGEEECLDTKVDEVKEISNINIYPNPCINQFIIENKGNSNSKIFYKVINAIGVTLSKGELKKNERVIKDFSNQNYGVYFIELHDGNTNKSFKKLIKIDTE